MPNTNYILTSSGSFLSEDELYHHGIKGMKWGVRKQKQAVSVKTAGHKLHKTKNNGPVSEFKRERKRQKRYLASKRAISFGRAAANRYLQKHDVTINGNSARISSGAEALAKLGLNYVYMKNTIK